MDNGAKRDQTFIFRKSLNSVVEVKSTPSEKSIHAKPSTYKTSHSLNVEITGKNASLLQSSVTTHCYIYPILFCFIADFILRLLTIMANQHSEILLSRSPVRTTLKAAR